MTPQTARKHSPIFVATITPGTIETKTSKGGAEYLLCAGARFERRDQEPQTRTVMAFGQSATVVRDLLTAGEPVELAVQFDGGTVKVIGAPRERQAAAAAKPAKPAKPAPKRSAMPRQLLLACIDAAGYDQNRSYG